MFKRTMMALAASAVAIAMTGGIAAAQQTLKIGASAPKTGPLAGGAAVTHWPSLQLWIHDVNARGGLNVGGKKLKVELVEYDDKTNPEEAVKNIQRLITVDKVDFLAAPYSTGINLATAPIIAKSGYPHVATSAATENMAEFAKRWPNSFWILGSSTEYAEGVVQALQTAQKAGLIGKRIAVVNVADAFGLELAAAGKPALKKAGFEIVYEASYPLGAQDLAPVISQAKAAKPDAFVAFSYPGDTFALTEQAQIQDLEVGVFYVGVGAAFPAFAGRFKDAATGIMGIGGINMSSKENLDFRRRLKEVTKVEPDYWGSAVVYSGHQILEQAIERAGTTDRAAVIAAIRKTPAKTVIGEIDLSTNVNSKNWTVGQWQDGAFHGVAAKGFDGAKAPIRKPAWKK
ncbi:MAG: amino acid ABC transporter substrate-binding protein [Bradyrhizobiaceae bacterium]|nr:amino acid ABC transporter substrate-binding protein [Bradyrhizobiaceae bacterium]